MGGVIPNDLSTSIDLSSYYKYQYLLRQQAKLRLQRLRLKLELETKLYVFRQTKFGVNLPKLIFECIKKSLLL